MSGLETNPFWQYSLERYGRDKVEGLCLRLQDEYGVNVNVLLWAGWLAEQGAVLEGAQLQRALTLLAPYQRNYIEPLRHMRNLLKSSVRQGLRKKILAAELEAEKAVQDELYQYYKREHWQKQGALKACLSDNILCVLECYHAATELPQGLEVLS